MNTLNLKPGHLSLAQLRAAYQAPLRLSLDASAHAAIDASVACVETIIAEGRTVGTYLGRMEYGPRALGARTIMAQWWS